LLHFSANIKTNNENYKSDVLVIGRDIYCNIHIVIFACFII